MPANLLSGNYQKNCIKGSKFLSSLDQDWNSLVSSVGPCKLNLSIELEPYQALIKSVIFQQLRPALGAAQPTKNIISTKISFFIKLVYYRQSS